MKEMTDNCYVVLVCNIHWSKNLVYVKRDNRDELPSQMSLDIPEAVLLQANKNKSSFNDVIESFCYNVLAKKFGHEVNRCQIWLPL